MTTPIFGSTALGFERIGTRLTPISAARIFRGLLVAELHCFLFFWHVCLLLCWCVLVRLTDQIDANWRLVWPAESLASFNRIISHFGFLLSLLVPGDAKLDGGYPIVCI